MTVGAAWIRKGSDGEELWMISDSRLSGDGNIWDDCPKLLALPRRDAVAGFSGSTAQAYPLLLQLSNAISCYRAAADGTLEFSHLVGHLERVANSMMHRILPDPSISAAQPSMPEFATSGDTLVLGGYSRAQGHLVIRSLRYLSGEPRWKFQHEREKTSLGRDRVIAIFGDNKSKSRFRYLLKLLLEERGILLQGGAFNFEPLEILAKILQMPSTTATQLPMDRRPATTGGSPQIFRVLPGAQATAVAVLWRTAEKLAVNFQGREIFGYENLDVPLVSFEDSELRLYGPSHWPQIATGSLRSDDNTGGESGQP